MLQSSAILIAGGLAGATLTTTQTDTVEAAETDVDLTVTGDEAEVREGDLAAIWLDVAVGWAYSVTPEVSPDTLVLEVLAGTDADDMHVVASDESGQMFLESSGDETFSVDLLAEDVLEADGLVPDEGGEVDETTVHVGVEMQLLDESGLAIAADAQTDTATLTIEKSDYDPDEYGSIAGEGELTIELA